MSSMSMAEVSRVGCYVGMGVALVPVTTTLIIASSRVVLVNIIANAILRVCTRGSLGINIHGLSLIQVPFLWKISAISAVVGGGIVAFSLLIALVNAAYMRSTCRPY